MRQTGLGRLTTHVLDTAHGRPAAGLLVRLFASEAAPRLIGEFLTQADGRCAAPLLEGNTFVVGRYELAFHVGDYYAALGLVLPEPRFLDVVRLAVGLAEPDGHYHVPLLCSPWSYSTYRGS